MSLWIKICGITNDSDARAAAEAGADAIGLNFARESPRCVAVEDAAEIADAVRGRATVVGVFVNALVDQILSVDKHVRFDRIQLHGDEGPEVLRRLGERAYKAFRVTHDADVRELSLYPGPWHLLDARVAGAYGGTGRTFDWTLARAAAVYGSIIVAGGLGPDNVAEAVRVARPFGVDTASGVEVRPGVKDAAKMEAFVHAARAAWKLTEAP